MTRKVTFPLEQSYPVLILMYRNLEQWMWIRNRLIEEGISQRELERETGVSRTTLSKMLAHPFPRLSHPGHEHTLSLGRISRPCSDSCTKMRLFLTPRNSLNKRFMRACKRRALLEAAVRFVPLLRAIGQAPNGKITCAWGNMVTRKLGSKSRMCWLG